MGTPCVTATSGCLKRSKKRAINFRQPELRLRFFNAVRSRTTPQHKCRKGWTRSRPPSQIQYPFPVTWSHPDTTRCATKVNWQKRNRRGWVGKFLKNTVKKGPNGHYLYTSRCIHPFDVSLRRWVSFFWINFGFCFFEPLRICGIKGQHHSVQRGWERKVDQDQWRELVWMFQWITSITYRRVSDIHSPTIRLGYVSQ